MGSTRFPGKIMAPFLPGVPGGPKMPVLWHVLTRCRAVPKVDLTILATPDSPDHAPAWDVAESLGCHVATGSELDVLDRYYQAARLYELTKPRDLIVRITADCPLIDPGVIQEVITLHGAYRADYACNVMPRSYPKGFDTEVMTFEALEAAWATAKHPYSREHVTPWLQKTDGIRRANLHQKRKDQARINLCVDYPGDIERIELFLKRWPGGLQRKVLQ